MTSLIVTFLLVIGVFPRPIGYVNDFAGIIESPWPERINALATELKNKTETEMAVVTLKDIDGFADIEEASNKIYEEWGIGKKGADKGFLILVVVGIRKVRVEVGYGLEGTLPDGFVGSVIRNTITPYFKLGRFGEGIYYGATKLAEKIAQEEGVTIGEGNPVPAPHTSRKSRDWLWILFMFFFFFPWFLGGKRRRGLIFFGPFWGFGGGFGSNSGGFGGFGGGASGGGGATGGW